MVDFYYVRLLSTVIYLLFRVEPNIFLGYSLFNPTPTGEHSLLIAIQYLGFAVMLSGLAWASRHSLIGLFKRLRGPIATKDAHSHERMEKFHHNTPPLVNNPPSKPKDSP